MISKLGELKTTHPTIYEIVRLVGVAPLYKYCLFTGKLAVPDDPICQQICPLSQLVCTTSPICDCVNNPGKLIIILNCVNVIFTVVGEECPWYIPEMCALVCTIANNPEVCPSLTGK